MGVDHAHLHEKRGDAAAAAAGGMRIGEGIVVQVIVAVVEVVAGAESERGAVVASVTNTADHTKVVGIIIIITRVEIVRETMMVIGGIIVEGMIRNEDQTRGIDEALFYLCLG